MYSKIADMMNQCVDDGGQLRIYDDWEMSVIADAESVKIGEGDETVLTLDGGAEVGECDEGGLFIAVPEVFSSVLHMATIRMVQLVRRDGSWVELDLKRKTAVSYNGAGEFLTDMEFPED